MSASDQGIGRDADIPEMVGDIIRAGVRRVHVLAWRDLDDEDAGGSEVHADEFMRRWADAGLDIVHRTSAARGLPAEADRHGYHVVRRGSRYTVFPRTAVSEVLRRMGRSDGLIEIWNGVPWFSPVWYRRRPRMTIMHHVHGPMWDQMLPGPLGPAGRFLEARIAPPFYRRTAMVTPSASTREELLELGFRPERVTAVENGVDPFFSPGGAKSTDPYVVVVGRFAPVKRFQLAVEAAAAARRSVPDLRVRLIGDGPLRPELDRWVAEHDATSWVDVAGRIDRHELLDEYRRAWVVLSASLAEGWGLTLTEAAACGTPAVATDIRGHRCSVVDGTTGRLAPPERLGETLATVLTDHTLRTRLGRHALARARRLTWEASATGVLRVFHGQVCTGGRPEISPSVGSQ
jgi:glycosyltransferase involved in cell wall biosynthesis